MTYFFTEFVKIYFKVLSTNVLTGDIARIEPKGRIIDIVSGGRYNFDPITTCGDTEEACVIV